MKGVLCMRRRWSVLFGLFCMMAMLSSAYADEADLIAKIDAVVSEGPENGNYFVGANDVYMWLKMKKTDFVVVDVRIGEKALSAYKSAHVPGAVYIPYNEMFKPENLQKLPKDKKIIFVCHMGASESLLIVPMRLLGYDAYGMLLGMAGWQKDYPAAEYVQGLIDAPKTKNYPLEREK
ncbi:MAG: rhodanese-like domain-containing protein [Nitrospirae bacterium]|nr:rhodanese-like domain-containing protein [Nitrospirota bacterium]